jgi:hypothetical protein
MKPFSTRKEEKAIDEKGEISGSEGGNQDEAEDKDEVRRGIRMRKRRRRKRKRKRKETYAPGLNVK